MEPSTESLHTENETETREVGWRGTAKENSAQSEASEGPAGQMESVPGPEAQPVEGSLPTAKGPMQDAPETAPAPPLKLPALGSAEPSETPAEMDCLVCFNRYSPCRRPKLLACQHTFCAVCLKLLLRREDRTWLITCPLCRKATVVFGGLICSLRDKEGLVDRLQGPSPDAELPCPTSVPNTGHAPCQPVPFDQDDAGGGANRAAAKRLVLLLLLVAMLILMVLPFMYTGLLKWALCFVLVLGLIMSVVLGCSPGWSCADRPWPPWRKKEGPVASAA